MPESLHSGIEPRPGEIGAALEALELDATRAEAPGGPPRTPRKTLHGTGTQRCHAPQLIVGRRLIIYINDAYHLGCVMDKARIFWSGRSQAVRLPKAYRFDGEEVRIRRRGAAVILEPIATDWEWLDAIAGHMGEDYFANGREQPGMPLDRPELNEVFR